MKARRLRISTWASRVFCITTLGDADAGVWSRRLAEAFCINALHKKYAAAGTSHVSTYPLLGRMVSDLPYSISWSRVYDLCEEGKDTATYLGRHLKAATVWGDLKGMQRYGNNGAHAHCSFLVI